MNSTKTKVTLILPCLNEEASLSLCIAMAKKGLKELSLLGYTTEFIIVDNNSSDHSVAVAQQHNVKVIIEPKRGYGSAYRTGMRHATGDILILADSDGTYDLTQLAPFIERINQGFDLVLGSRFMGSIASGAMPFLNRYVGNPLLTKLLNTFYHGSISDAHTGMRAIRKKTAQALHLSSDGMEFASEMIVKALLKHVSLSEIPISYAPRIGTSKLLPLSDAMRHIRFILLYAPTYVVVFPGIMFTLIGFLIALRLYIGPLQLGHIVLDTHTLLFSSLILQLGLYITLTGIFAREYTEHSLSIHGGILGRFLLRFVTGERLLWISLLFLIGGMILSVVILSLWIQDGFGTFSMMRETIGAMTLVSIGTILLFSSFLFSLFPYQE